MKRSWWWSPALLVALVALPYAARADQRRVALAVPDQELANALAVALSPTECEVVNVEAATGARDVGRSAPATADAYDAVAVVWLERLGGGYLLSAYSAISGDVGERPLDTGPPYDAAAAVAVAFSIKTLLREGGVIETPSSRTTTDDDDALDDFDEEADAGEDEVAALDRAIQAGLLSPAPAPGADLTHRASPASPSRLWFEIGAAMQVTGGETDRPSSIHGGATYWFGRSGGRFGAFASVARATTLEVESAALSADLEATEVAIGARGRLGISRRLALVPDAGVALRTTSLRGATADGSEALSSSRVGTVVRGGLSLALFVSPRVALALSLRFDFLAQPALYTWRGQTVLEEPWTRRAVGLRAIVAL